MNLERIITYFESSIVKDLLLDKEITDISFNGDSLYYLHNFLGRKSMHFRPKKEEIRDFVRQIANLSEQQFSFSSPILDVSFGKYRFNAVHSSIAVFDGEETTTFSVRIASDEIHIKNDDAFFPLVVGELIDILLELNESIVIGGITGTGKTEFQKYLLSRMKENTKVIVIDNVLELDNHKNYQDIDLTIWKADDHNNYSSIQSLVRNALRNNPDWLIVAESRGVEMVEVLNSAMSGHPIITTIHALDAQSMPHRMARMVMMSNKKETYEEILGDIHYHFHYCFFLKRKINEEGEVIRYLDMILEISKDGKAHTIFSRKKDGNYTFHTLNKDMISLIDLKSVSKDFAKVFMGEKE